MPTVHQEISDEIRETITGLATDLNDIEIFVDSARDVLQKGNDVLILLNQPGPDGALKIKTKLNDFENHLSALDERKIALENLKGVFSKLKHRSDVEFKQQQKELEGARTRIVNLELENSNLHEELERQKAERDKFQRLEQEAQKQTQSVEFNLEEQKRSCRMVQKEKRVLALEIQNLRDLLKEKEKEFTLLESSKGTLTKEIEKCLSGLKISATAVANLSLIRGNVLKLNHHLEHWNLVLESSLVPQLKPNPESAIPDLEVRHRSNTQLDELMTRIVNTEDSLNFEGELVELSTTCIDILKNHITSWKLFNTAKADEIQREAESQGIIMGAATGIASGVGTVASGIGTGVGTVATGLGSVVTTGVSYVPILGSLLVTSADEIEEEVLDGLDIDLHTANPSEGTITPPSEGEDAPQFWNPVLHTEEDENPGEEEVALVDPYAPAVEVPEPPLSDS